MLDKSVSDDDTIARDNEAAEDSLRSLEAEWQREQRDAVISPVNLYSNSDGLSATTLELQDSRAQRQAVMRQVSSLTFSGARRATAIDTFLSPSGALGITVKPGEDILIVGQCELKVLSGIITLSGAMLAHFDGRLSVFAPVRQPLPIIKCLNGVARVEVCSTEKGIDALDQISLHYRGIWVSDVQTNVGTKTCTLVSHLGSYIICISHIKSPHVSILARLILTPPCM